jgi:epsilon-lactone hydrolase
MVSPLYADLTGLPPMLLQMSDMEVLTDEDMLLAERAQAAGIEVNHQISHGLMHVWHIYWRYLEQARDSIKEIVTYIGEKAGH